MSTATIPDLWPTDLDPPVAEPTPSGVLRQQGYLLGQRTGNVVYGEVRSQSFMDQDGLDLFIHSFHLRCSYMEYDRVLLSVKHGLIPYPADLIVNALPSQSVLSEKKVSGSKELTDTLREVFSREDVIKIIRSLRTQTRDLDDE